MATIGIDIGTSCSRMAWYNNNRVEIIKDNAGNQTFPSRVEIDGVTVFNTKRLLGKKYNELQLKHIPYRVTEDEYGYPMILGKYKPEFIVSLIVSKLLVIAKNHCGQEIKQAVVSVPAYFSDNQRKATKVACELAGLHVLRLINEPTAACLCTDTSEYKEILIVDIGAGTTDVSLVEIIVDDVFSVTMTAGDDDLGGEDFTSALMDHLHLDRNICEQIKKDGTCAEFKQVCAPLLERVRKCIRRVGKAKSVLLIGGASETAGIKEIISELNIPIVDDIDPILSTARGLAIYGAQLTGQLTKEVLLLDVTAMTLGVFTAGDIFYPIIKRNTLIPCTKKHVFTTSRDMQKCVDIKVYQGERTVATKNKLLGVFLLEGLPMLKRGVAQIEVVFNVDVDGIITLTATELSTGNNMTAVIAHQKSDVKSSSQETENDRRYVEREQLRQLFVQTCDVLINNDELPKKIKSVGQEGLMWLSANPSADVYALTAKLNEIRNM